MAQDVLRTVGSPDTWLGTAVVASRFKFHHPSAPRSPSQPAQGDAGDKGLPPFEQPPVTKPPSPKAIAAFLLQMRACSSEDDTHPEALDFIELLLTHRQPPAAQRKLMATLLRAVPRHGTRAEDTAAMLQRAAHEVTWMEPAPPYAGAIRMILSELAIRHHDTAVERMRLVETLLGDLGQKMPGFTAVIPQLDPEVTRRLASAQARGALALRRHLRGACQCALREVPSAHPFRNWSRECFDAALLALRLGYCVFSVGASGRHLSAEELREDFRRCGQPLWDVLRRNRPAAPDSQPDVLADEGWHLAAQGEIILALDAKCTTRTVLAPTLVLAPQEMTSGTSPTLVVCRRPIAPSSERSDKEEVERHRVLEQPLPLTAMPSVDALGGMLERLTHEFPWAEAALDLVIGDLIGRSRLGVATLTIPPTLLVGPPGSGKSRLARRIAEEFGLPRLDLAVGGSSDSKVLGGTSRGWSSGKPSDLATLFAQRRVASALVLLDELDKAVEGSHRNDAGIHAYLLGLLEPETASRHTDVFLKTECDFSEVSWIATANRLSPIPTTLRSRLRTVHLRQPMRGDYPRIAENVLLDLARSWRVERFVFPDLADLDVPLDQLSSAREVRFAVEHAVTTWARFSIKH